jgi:hypothetical protein
MVVVYLLQIGCLVTSGNLPVFQCRREVFFNPRHRTVPASECTRMSLMNPSGGPGDRFLDLRRATVPAVADRRIGMRVSIYRLRNHFRGEGREARIIDFRKTSGPLFRGGRGSIYRYSAIGTDTFASHPDNDPIAA